MKRFAIVPAIALAATAVATPSYADLKADYLAACLAASNQNTELCTCKAEEAVKHADDEMLGFIIIAMKDNAKFRDMVKKGEVPDAVVKKWPIYVRESNAVCVPPAN
ncbi:MAG TPA: hypothetical protein VIN06_15645 [Devosia sp.]